MSTSFREIVFLCGVPGSGKTTLTEVIKEMVLNSGLTFADCSADKFPGLYGLDGKTFTRSLLRRAHQRCQEDCELHCSDGINYVVIDNTNLVLADLLIYLECAKKYDYTVKFIVPKRGSLLHFYHSGDEMEHIRSVRCSDGCHRFIPESSIEQMLKRFLTMQEFYYRNIETCGSDPKLWEDVIKST